MWHYVNYTSSQEQAEGCSADCFSDMFQSAPSSWKNTLAKSCCSANEMESYHGSRSGTTPAPLMVNHGATRSTLLQEGFHVKISHAVGLE